MAKQLMRFPFGEGILTKLEFANGNLLAVAK